MVYMTYRGDDINLTKQEALAWHRKMWIWIAKEIARCKHAVYIIDLKRRFCLENNIRGLKGMCFCCEYVHQINNYVSHEACLNLCPVVWQESTSKVCEFAEYGSVFECDDWKKQAKLAYKIAMLPERKSA